MPSESDTLLSQIDALTNECERQLTAVQRRRSIAAASGKTPTAIARDEGVSRQSVVETLKSAAVRETLGSMVGRCSLSTTVNGVETDKRTLPWAAIEVLGELLHADKAIVHGAYVTTVPDNQLRFQAACKLLELVEPRVATPTSPATPQPASTVVDTVVEEHTRRIAQRRTSE